jgi:hypothetical protein
MTKQNECKGNAGRTARPEEIEMIDLNRIDATKLEYAERLRYADRYRQELPGEVVAPGMMEQAVLGLSHCLIETGERLKERVNTHPNLN